MASLRQRLDGLERVSPDRKSVYEMSDQELIVGMGLSKDATDEEVDAHIRKVLRSRSPPATCLAPAHDDAATPPRRLMTNDHNDESTS